MVARTDVIMMKALDGLAARADVTAQNVSNAGTRGYVRLRITFEDALRRAAGVDDRAVLNLKPGIGRVPATGVEGHDRLDLELATASATALRYGALIAVLGRQLQFEELAMNGSG